MTKCFWCDQVKETNREHVFPHALGGELIVPIGLVCAQCNSRLGSAVDADLKYSCQMFMDLYQKSSFSKGSPIGEKKKGGAKIRKELEVGKIKSKISNLEVERDHLTGDVRVTNYSPADDNLYNEVLSRGLHKMAVNVALLLKGAEFSSSNYTELRDYVNTGVSGGQHPRWSYAVCPSQSSLYTRFSPSFFPIRCSSDDSLAAIFLIFPTGIFLVGLKPDLINANSLGDFLNASPGVGAVFSPDFPLKKYYSKSYKFIGISKEPFIEPRHGLEFELFVKPVDISLEDAESYSPVVECAYCKNITTIGLTLPKGLNNSIESIFSGCGYCAHCAAQFSFQDQTFAKPN